MPLTFLEILALLLAVAVAGAGVWLLRHGRSQARRGGHESGGSADRTDWPAGNAPVGAGVDPREVLDRVRSAIRRWSAPTRLAIGLAMIGGAYHIAAYASPDHWFPLKVPQERWWLVVAVVGLVVFGALLADRLESWGDDGS